MAYKLEVNHPDFPEGWDFNLDGILCKNGNTVTVTKEMEQDFITRVGHTIKEIYGHSNVVKLSGSSELSSKKVEDSEGGDS